MLVSAASTAKHRLLVFRVCDGGRCSSDAYLQWFHEFPPQAIHTAPVPELSEGRVVTSARWVRNRTRPGLLVVVAPYREDLDPVTMFVVPGKPGRYEIHR